MARKLAEKILQNKAENLLIEELRKANTKLKILLSEKSSQLEGVLENSIDAYLVIDLRGNVLKFNEAAIQLFEYDNKNNPINVDRLIHEEDRQYASDSFLDLQKNGFLKALIIRISLKSKKVKWVQINANLIYNQEKTPIAAQGIIRDITKEKLLEENLIESESRISSMITHLESGILIEDEQRKIVVTNAKFCELFHISAPPELLKGHDCSNEANESKHLCQQPEKFVHRIAEIITKKEKVLGDLITLKDGTILKRDFIPILNEKKYIGHLWRYKDITIKRQFDEILEAQKQKYSNIIANMNLGLIEVSNNDEILMINQSFSEMSGYKESELLGKRGSQVFLDEDAPIIQRETTKRLAGTSNSYEIKVKNKQGKERQWLVSGASNYDFAGKVIGSIGIHLDITEFKSLEKQKEIILKELENRNHELQEYAHIVSHDLKSPLRSIDALLSWIKANNHDNLDEATLENIELIEVTLEKMEKLISDILEYSSAGLTVKNHEKVNLNLTIKNLKKIIFIPKNITVTTLKELPILNGDATKFQQLFQNLISNAVKFCDKETGIVEIDVTEKKSYYKFSIKDNGIGIEKEYYDKIFKIFQYLNQREDSTGVGLSIVKKIVDLYEGNIWVDSELGVGTTFYFTIKKS
ncbi:PAS domain-containing sensor histidine kinase [Polaribacter sp. IC063]|uniref:PAS domain-containing sensor histidine kinase n=1 Tax=Polaribacter sp. IC063 TaxID=57031 RepID=UPI0011BF33BB|nr:PAS domain-containing sensor histidine kinase [Polaribacter sp. IC063]TXD50474.1 PAS domain S-box protein [Polaribacter sp. IC063]